MSPYIRFCSCQLNSAALLQKKTETDNKFNEAHAVCGFLLFIDSTLSFSRDFICLSVSDLKCCNISEGINLTTLFLRCFDTVGWVTETASGL